MDATRRRRARGLPALSGPEGFGALVLFVALGFGAAAVPALVTPRERAAELTQAPARAHVSAGPAALAAKGPSASPRMPRLQARPGNQPPRIHSAAFHDERVTALVDLRLVIEASDPDGDPIALRTTWWIDGEPHETESPVLTREHFSRGSRLRAEVVAVDGSHASAPCSTEEIVVGNAPPSFTTFPRGFDATGAFVYPIGVIDADGDRELEIQLLEAPDGMRIEAHEGTLSWRPRPDQAGRHAVRVEVRDGRGGSDSQAFALQVRPTPAAAAAAALAER